MRPNVAISDSTSKDSPGRALEESQQARAQGRLDEGAESRVDVGRRIGPRTGARLVATLISCLYTLAFRGLDWLSANRTGPDSREPVRDAEVLSYVADAPSCPRCTRKIPHPTI